MANITLTNLPTVTSLNGTEPLLGVQSNSSVQITTRQIATYTLGIVGIGLPVTVPNGGTGQTSFTSNAILIGNGTGSLNAIAPPAGTNYVLVGSSTGTPSWQPTIPVTAGVDSISFGTTGLTPSTDTAGVITVAGTLAAKNGGTGQSSYTIGDLLYASSSTALSKLADVATGSVLVSGGVGAAPSYSSSPTISGTTTSSFFIANGTITGSQSQGAYAYGTLGYSDTNIFQSFASSVNSYNQNVMQNTNAGASASTNIIVSNNLGTANTYFGEFGMNSSGFTGTGAFNAASTVYLDATSADLAIGTTTANAIHFVVNGGATDAATISSAGVFSLGTALAVGSGGTGQSSNWTQWGAIYASTTGALASTAAGTTGQVLIGNTGAAPSWAAATSVSVTSISFGTTGLTPNTATQGAVTVAGTLATANGGTNLTTFTAANNAIYSTSASVLTAGTLPVAAGGTGQASALTQYGVVYGSTTTAMATSAAGTTGQPLLSNTTSGPAFGALAIGTANTNISGALTVTNGGTGVATLASNGVLYGNATGVVQVTAQGAANTILTANAGAPSFSATPTIGTSVTVPLVIGGTATSSTLTLQSTSGVGATDSVVIKVGNNGAVTAATFNTVGVASSVNWYNTATQTATNTVTLTAAQITSPFLLGTPTATASYTLPLASAVETALGTPPNETGWEFVVFTTAAFAITLLTNTGWTLVGSMATGATANSFARFRARKTGSAAYTLYRIS